MPTCMRHRSGRTAAVPNSPLEPARAGCAPTDPYPRAKGSYHAQATCPTPRLPMPVTSTSSPGQNVEADVPHAASARVKPAGASGGISRPVKTHCIVSLRARRGSSGRLSAIGPQATQPKPPVFQAGRFKDVVLTTRLSLSSLLTSHSFSPSSGE